MVVPRKWFKMYIYIGCPNPYQANIAILYPLKTLEVLRRHKLKYWPEMGICKGKCNSRLFNRRAFNSQIILEDEFYASIRSSHASIKQEKSFSKRASYKSSLCGM